MTSGIPLGLMRDGSAVCVRDIVASERVKCQLFEQGLVPGSSLSIVKNDIGGPLIICIKDTRLALGRGVAMQILVEEKVNLKNFKPELVYSNLSDKVAVEK